MILRVRNARDGELVFARQLLLLGLAAGLARLPGPEAVACCIGELVRRDLDHDSMGVGQNVVFPGATPGIAALAGREITARLAIRVVAGVIDSLRRPAETALLVLPAGGRRALVG